MNKQIFELASVISVMLLGAPGIGKTAMITDFASSINADLVDIRLSAETPSSFEGKDYICQNTGTLKKARAWWLQRIDKNKELDIPTVLFFDEYTNAPDALQQLAYSPFNERRLHGISFDYKLKNGNYGLYVFGAGNRVCDETGAREMVYASKTRVFTVECEPNVKQWLKWAEKNNINETVKSFIYANPDALIEKASTGTACPREWSNLSIALNRGIDYKTAAHGTIKGSNEEKFCAFYKDSTLCPTIDEIVNGTAEKSDIVHLTSFVPTIALALKSYEGLTLHFPKVFDWIASQSDECKVMFTKYSTDLFSDTLLQSKECMKRLNSVAKAVGVNAK